MCAGAATTTVYPQTNADESAFILADSGSRVLIAEDAAQLAKAREKRAELPELTHVVVIDPAGVETGDGVLTLAELEKRGAAYLEKNPELIKERVGAITADQLATLIYTSGTTGRPKGVRLPHDNWSYMAKAIAATGLLGADDVQYLWLPLAHVFGKVLTSGQIEVGHVTAVDGRVDKIIENLPVVQPTYMAAVPRIFEKVYNGVAAKARAGGGAKYKIFQWAAEVAREYAKATQDNFRRTGTAVRRPSASRAKHKVADALVFAKIREAFGGNLRACVSGSAALAPEIGYFFAGAGIHILEGYGLTESSAASFVNPGEAYRTGTVGKPLPGTEVRIADDGEILLRGPGIMEGYHGLPEKTAEVLESDGWFHTGDIGELSPDGYLRITDRKKDLIKTSGGKYIAPAEVEGQFKAVCPYVSNILVHGADRNFCTALIALDEPSILGWAKDNGLGGQVVRGGRGRAGDRRAHRGVRQGAQRGASAVADHQEVPAAAAGPRRGARRDHAESEAEAAGRGAGVQAPDRRDVRGVQGGVAGGRRAGGPCLTSASRPASRTRAMPQSAPLRKSRLVCLRGRRQFSAPSAGCASSPRCVRPASVRVRLFAARQ